MLTGLRRTFLLVALCCASFAVSDVSAETYEVTTLWNQGPSSNRVDLVFLGDGYTASQIETTYAGHVENVLSYMFGGEQDPYPRYSRFFNVHRIDVVSAESGVDKSGLDVDTALDATYEPVLQVSRFKADSAVMHSLTDWETMADMRLVTVNSSTYGGSGLYGAYAVIPGGSSSAGELALHETGHSFANLADEYYSTGKHYGAEPREPNVTADPTGSKWANWLGYDDPDNGLSVVGAYEGARYVAAGLYRPTTTSKMRALYQPFNAVSREAIIERIYGFVDPLDDWVGNTTGRSEDEVSLEETGRLWVDVVDPDILDIRWSLEGAVLDETSAEMDLFALGCGPGTWRVEAQVSDQTPWVRSGLEDLIQSLVFDVTLSRGAGDVDYDNDVDFADLTALRRQFGQETTPYTSADFNGDGWVNQEDLGILQKYYGMAYRSQAGLAPPVPEPSALILLALGGGILFRRRRPGGKSPRSL